MTPEIRSFFLSPDPLIITKANVRSTVHRRAYMDYIGVKIYGDKGEISGELRIVGLFTSTAYTRSTRNIPFLRQKGRGGSQPCRLRAQLHSGKALMNVLETFPRDELFQISVDTLYETAVGIQALDLRPRARAFARLDQFDRFVSIIVYVPRDRFFHFRARADRRVSGRSLPGQALRLLSLLSRRSPRSHPFYHRSQRRTRHRA